MEHIRAYLRIFVLCLPVLGALALNQAAGLLRGPSGVPIAPAPTYLAAEAVYTPVVLRVTAPSTTSTTTTSTTPPEPTTTSTTTTSTTTSTTTPSTTTSTTTTSTTTSTTTPTTTTSTTPPEPANPFSGTAGLVWASFSDLGEAQANNAVAVVFCESSLRPSSTNVNGGGSKDYGLWQFNDGGTLQGVFADVEGREPGPGEAEAVALDIGWNLAAGRTLFDQRGWRPWACASKVGVTTRLWGSTPGASWGALPDIS